MNTSHAATDDSVAAKWSIGLVEPLLSTGYRVALDEAMVAETAKEPTWASAWFGGVISDMIMTLPQDDPWRAMSATISCRRERLARGASPPEDDGAVLRGKRFQDYRAATDVVELVFGDPTLDVGFAALVEPLEPLAAALVAFGGGGWKTSIDACQLVMKITTPSASNIIGMDADERSEARLEGARRFFAVASTAVRWAVHRRKSYGLVDDPWPVESGWCWEVRARKIAGGKPWASGDLELALHQERIESETVEEAEF